MELLTVKDVAALKGCSERYIKRVVADGKIAHVESLNEHSHKKYLIPVDALDIGLQRKWYLAHRAVMPPELHPASKASPSKEPKSLETYTQQQREQIDQWISLLNRWQAFRAAYEGPLSEADTAFVQAEGLDISIKTLYRRWAAFKSDNMDGLIERRGLWKKGQSSIAPEIWKVFLSYYLDQAYYSVAKCIKSTREFLHATKAVELLDAFPSNATFYARISSDIPAAVETYCRKGPKALHDRYAPYIRRRYDNMLSNEYWVADNHTFDFMTLGANGRPHRVYLTAIIDARSTAMIGWQVTNSPCGDATLSALRKAIQPPGGRKPNGVPDNFYVDNGSEFLVHDIGGRGHRKRKSQQNEFEPPGVLKRLGINMINAIPGNPEAKIIERVYLDVKNEFSRSIETFCGGTIAERPERLNRLLKSRNIPTDQEIIQAVDEWVEGYYNHLPYGGSVQKDRGKTKIQVYNENLQRMRLPATMEDLNLMMMRSSRAIKVGRRGVKYTVAGFTIDYWTDEFLVNWQDKKVYFRYDPDDLSSVRVYNEEDKFICVLPADNVAITEYGASSEAIKAGMQKINKYNKVVQQWTDNKILSKDEKISVYTLMQLHARENLQNPPEYMEREPKIIEFIHASEDTYEYPMAVGDSGAMLTSMIQNARMQIKEDDDHGKK